jgi:predicted RecA/RadA family phage recombinase
MATNFVQPGRHITVTAPTGGVLSGDGVLIGTLFGIAQYDAAEGAEVEILTEGVVEIGKTSALAIGVGDRLFWDATNKVVNKTATAQVCVGVAVSAAANPSSTVKMKLGAVTPAGT